MSASSRHQPPSTGQDKSHAPSQSVRQALMTIGDELRARSPWLVKYQNFIGSIIMFFAVSMMALCGYAYGQGWLNALPTILIIAVATSLIHELEHDLIHYLYFRKHPIPHNLMLLICWLTRPGTVNPWIRRRLHLLHHKVSGSHEDVEERGITNGIPWSPLRLLMIADGTLAILGRAKEAYKAKRLHLLLIRGFVAYFPIGIAYYITWYTYLLFHISHAVAPFWAANLWPSHLVEVMPVINFIAVVFMWPFFIRSFCLNFISSNMHYYGDVENNNIIQQTQVWTTWWLAPLHLFCFNFAGTHAIHHFVVRDPFYIRQWIARQSYPVMRKSGVRFNDFSTFKRANRFNDTQRNEPEHI